MKRDNQIQIHRLYPEDTMPTLIICSQLLKATDDCLLRYPKYALWERILVVPLETFHTRIESLRQFINTLEIFTEDKTKKDHSYMTIDQANSENYIDIESLSSEEISKMRDDL